VTSYGAPAAARRIGVLYLDSRERGYLQHVGLLHALAAEAAVVIENARLYREVVDKERAEHELRIAAEIQQGLLPPPEHASLVAELAAITTPCRSVGGDFFEYVARDNGGISFAVGDVAGKGTSAALLTAVVQGLFAAEAEMTGTPADVLARINRALCRRAVAARFVTAFYGQLAGDGKLRYCNAGHNPPFLISKEGVTRLETGGSVVGLFDHAAFENGIVDFLPGDLLVVFSDGVTEAENTEGEEFGDDRLAACVEAARMCPTTEVRDRLVTAVRTFCGDVAPRDDVTVMVIRGQTPP
jgi:sigma-B regulation protein RsbU (phosphoserine phosphatase)